MQNVSDSNLQTMLQRYKTTLLYTPMRHTFKTSCTYLCACFPCTASTFELQKYSPHKTLEGASIIFISTSLRCTQCFNSYLSKKWGTFFFFSPLTGHIILLTEITAFEEYCWHQHCHQNSWLVHANVDVTFQSNNPLECLSLSFRRTLLKV